MADIRKDQEREELHRAIWAIADELRGSVDGWDFKSYVLGMMFYRYISENLTNYINEGEAEAGNEGFDYTTFPKYITKPEHRFYRDVNEKNGDYYRRWAAGFGPYTAKMIDSILLSNQHEEQSYNSCNGILHMCTSQSKLLVEEASRLCVEGNACRYSYFKRCLKQLMQRSQEKVQQKLPSHENLRGKEFYK